MLHPGRTLGAIEFDKVLCDQGCKADVTVAEAGTFIYASRSDGPAQARIFRIKEAVPLAALPATRTAQVLEALAPAYPQFIDGINVLRTGLDNMGAIFHPALTLLNAGRIESTHGDYEFYIEGVTPSVARVLEALDRERVTVAASLGIRAQTAQEWLKMAYDAEGEDLNEAIHNQPGYLRHQGAQHAEPSLHLRGHSDEPGADRGAGPALWRLGARDGCDHPPGVHHPPHRLLAPRPHAGEAGHRPAQRRRTDAVRQRRRALLGTTVGICVHSPYDNNDINRSSVIENRSSVVEDHWLSAHLGWRVCWQRVRWQ